MLGLRAPVFRLLAAVYLCAFLVATTTWLVLQAPRIGVRFTESGPGAVQVMVGAKLFANLDGAVPVTFATGAQRVTAPAAVFAVGASPDLAGPKARAQHARMNQLDEMAQARALDLEWPTASGAGQVIHLPLTVRKAQLGDIGADYWLLILSGVGGFLLGAWILALRPQERGARMLALSGFGMMVAALSSAVYIHHELIASGAVMDLAIQLNTVGTQLCGGAMVALFALYPRQVVKPVQLWIIPLILVPSTLAALFGLVPMTIIYVVMLGQFVAIVGLLTAQWRLARGDPQASATLRWIALSTLFGTSAFVLLHLTRLITHQPPILSQGVAFLLLLVIYAGMAAGVGRYRLFDLDRWACRIILAVGGACSLVLVDAALILGFRLAPASAVSLSLLATGLIYLPARGLLWRWVSGHPPLSDADMFQAVEDVRFAADPDVRRERWRALLVQLFDPLEIAVAQAPVPRPALLRDGLEMMIPGVNETPALVLRLAARGRQLFTRQQVVLVAKLVALMQSAEMIRDGYARGVAEERRRIARDLHDDVGGRLLTSLHGASPSMMREDVQTAISDIRAIVRGLTGERLPVSWMIANLRHETLSRLDSTGVLLDWPFETCPDNEPMLDYVHYRNITSAHREVITNILRHSGAGRVVVQYEVEDGRLKLTIEDDGRGRRRDQAEGGGRGLSNIQQRLAEIGGNATLVDRPQGFRVELVATLCPKVVGA